jgi:hypothetical protein
MCDDVSANKSLFGNERETPSTRSLVTRWSQAGRGQAGPGGNPVLPGHQREGCETIPPASDIRARNRTRFANVSLETDDATRSRPPGPGVVQ